MTDKTFSLGTHSDKAQVVATLSQAFQTDPALGWILQEPDNRRRRLPKLFNLLHDAYGEHGMVLQSPGGEAASIWKAPFAGATEPDGGLKMILNMIAIFGFAVGRGKRVSDALDQHRPKHPYWYLAFVGVRPEFQGKGWGGAIIRDALARIEGDGLPAYLETATPENVPLYLRLGFEIIEEWDVPGGGPHFWSMLRPA